ncbi:peptidase M48 [Thalassotalea insulae]|uniref:Peptidase M48 n=1 Tax=Thalassotalea insulae TaxID=2056778 RepID=A0ABQ6GYF0_9GAMM|nr:M48 family metallopeptidase [Thalassotalea insulae]GLX79775.1 peptidase M48 [Thalassotalea insulae]
MTKYSTIRGVYYAPRSSKSQNIKIDIVNEQAIVADEVNEQKVAVIPLSEITLTPALGAIPREFMLENGAKVMLFAEQDISPLQHNIRPIDGLLHYLEQHRKVWLISLILIPICFYALSAYAIPAFAQSVVSWLPEEVKYEIDKQSMLVLDKSMLAPSQLSLNTKARISEQWNNLIPQINTQHQQFKLLFRSGKSFGANAFGLPGGTVVISDQLVDLLAQTPDAVLAVLLHEIGHVEYNHGLQLATESIATSLLLTYFLGDLNELAEYFSGAALTLIQNNFSRELERAADDYATTKLLELGISPQAFAVAMSKLAKNSPEKDDLLLHYLSSHPLVEERISNALKKK